MTKSHRLIYSDYYASYPLSMLVQMNGLGLGAMYLEGGSGSIRGCHFYDNHALGGGGGALEFLHVTLTIDSTRFEHNSATGVGARGEGGRARAWCD